MTDELKNDLLKVARSAILNRFDGSPVILPKAEELLVKRGLFVTLYKQGKLRGCIGFIKGYKSILDSVVEMAQSAAFQDNRFSPVRAQEMPEIVIEISILSELEPVDSISNIVIGKHGLLLQHPHGSGVFLPQVAFEWNWDLKTYLQELCRKAGLHSTAWKEKEAQLYSFTSEVFAEDDFLA